jgi:glycosyltransferase involved in cell wall biosynthesis
MSPKLLYLVTEDWYFWSHRLPMARAARAAGFEVVVATRVDGHRQAIETEGFRVHPLNWRRRNNGVLSALAALREIRALYRRERPDLVHHVAIKPVVLGGLAAWLTGTPAVVNALTGLGFVFIDNTPGDGELAAGDRGRRLLKGAVRRLIRFVLGRQGSHLVLQNTDDHALLVGHGVVAAERVTVIRGSGIDTEHYTPQPEAIGTQGVTVAYVGRMLEDKGVPTLVEAQQRVRARGIDLRLLLVGTPDADNPTSVPEATLRAWAALPGIEWRGAVADVRRIWAEAHIAALPSRREGLPKSLLEAAACGRALVATDVPGCREIARAGENALLVPPDDPAALARALETLATDAPLRARFAAASRALVLSDLAVGPVGTRTVALYRRLLAEQGSAPHPPEQGSALHPQGGAPP